MANLSIRPIPLYLGPMQTSKFTYMHYWQDLTSIAGYMWYIEGTKKNILIDAGITVELLVKKGGPLREKPQDMEEGLAKLGLKPSDIDTIIITHLDHDHVELAPKFKNAKFIVQKKELDFCLNPHPALANRFLDKSHYEAMNFEVIEGDQKIEPGLSVMFTPGHTPGTQSIVVDTAKGKAVITGFCCTDINMFPPANVLKEQEVIPLTIHTNMFDCYDNMVKVKKMADIVVPLHSPRFCWIDRIG